MSDELPDFGDREAVEAWLRKQPREVAVGLATREALRTLPLLAQALEHPLGPSAGRLEADKILPVFRAASSAWLWLFWGNHSELRRAIAAAAAEAAAQARRADVAPLAANAVAESAAHAASGAANTGDVCQAAAAAARRGAAPIVALVDPERRDTALTAPLWSEGVPERFSAEWRQLKAHLLSREDEHWEVWTDWYEARLRGAPPDWEQERARVLDLDDFWEQGPKAVNEEIARRLGYADGARDLPVGADEGALSELPTEVSDASLGTFERDPASNRLRLVPRPAERPELGAPPIRRDFANRVRTLAGGLADLADDMEGRVNVEPLVLANMRRYRDEAGKEPIEEIIPDRLAAIMDRLRDAYSHDDTRDMMGELFAPPLGRFIDGHDRLMADFYGDAMERRARLDPGLADPEADLAEIAAAAADVPRRLEDEAPPELPRADPEFQAQMDDLASEIRDMARSNALLAEGRRAEARRRVVVLAQQLVATVGAFVVEVGKGATVDAGKWTVRATVVYLLARMFGIHL